VKKNNKIKVSFTINEKINDIIENMIKNKTIKNKSQFIEKVLNEYLNNNKIL
jgi:metal-responsive CopG/Arc/MetJ family transcriptional regulator